MKKGIDELIVSIIGLGVVGGAFAEGLKNIGVGEVYGVDIDTQTLIKAKAKGIIDEGFLNAKIPISNSDIVIISLYPNLLKNFMEENIEFFKEGSIVTDAVGIKSKIIDELKPILEKSKNKIDFIFGHPMAGREKRGIDFADSKVFQNANYILINDIENKKENIDLFEKLIHKLGFKNINFLTKEEHDEIIAFTSQLTHAIAVALMNSDNEKYETNKYIGDSFRDLTRIAKINEDLWSELFLGNKDNLLKMIEQFEKKLEVIKKALNDEDGEKLKEEFIISSNRREKIN